MPFSLRGPSCPRLPYYKHDNTHGEFRSCTYWGTQLTALRLDGLIHCRDDKELNPLVAHGCLDNMFSLAVLSVYLIVETIIEPVVSLHVQVVHTYKLPSLFIIVANVQ